MHIRNTTWRGRYRKIKYVACSLDVPPHISTCVKWVCAWVCCFSALTSSTLPWLGKSIPPIQKHTKNGFDLKKVAILSRLKSGCLEWKNMQYPPSEGGRSVGYPPSQPPDQHYMGPPGMYNNTQEKYVEEVRVSTPCTFWVKLVAIEICLWKVTI